MAKNYSNLPKISIFRLLKMAANQIQCSRLEQKSIIKFLVAEKCQPEICWRMCDVYGEACFSKKCL